MTIPAPDPAAVLYSAVASKPDPAAALNTGVAWELAVASICLLLGRGDVDAGLALRGPEPQDRGSTEWMEWALALVRKVDTAYKVLEASLPRDPAVLAKALRRVAGPWAKQHGLFYARRGLRVGRTAPNVLAWIDHASGEAHWIWRVGSMAVRHAPSRAAAMTAADAVLLRRGFTLL